MMFLKKKIPTKELYIAGPSDLNDGKCAFALTNKSKFAGVVFRLDGVEVDDLGQIMLKYEILYCPPSIKNDKALAKEIGKVLDDLAVSTEEEENV